uniref:Uncharacterized protein n=1 Tax=Globisporangium ultimum (strain ATCC 200006 / CBS 805.95 / DAOM BR144) TaxID=431595 RepID=K3WMH2_GLOUD
MHRIDELPLHVVLHVLSFALDDYTGVDGIAWKPNWGAHKCPQRLASVSSAWHVAMQSVVAFQRESTLSFTFSSSSSKKEDLVRQGNGKPVVNRKLEEERMPEVVRPSRLLAHSVVRFFSSIVSKLQTPYAYPWDEYGVETTGAPIDTPDAQERSAATKSVEDSELDPSLLNEIHRFSARLRKKSVAKLYELRLCGSGDLFATDDSCRPTLTTSASEKLQSSWMDAFAMCPALQRLDLSKMSLLSPHLPCILVAASAYCRDINVLIMPQQECVGYQRRNAKPVFDAFYYTLRNWHMSLHDPASFQIQHLQRGLRRLVMPKLFAYEFYDEHMTTIAQYCPKLEFVEGLRLAPIFQARGLSHHQVMASWITAWQAFCESCTHLREWNWFEIPFVDDFFAIFAAQPKPQLDTLTLPGNTTLWKRDYVFQEHQEPANCVCTSQGIISIFRACLNLVTLQVLFSDRHLMFGMDENPFLIDDAFLRKVVQACPKIERLRLTEVEARHGFEKTNAITEAGICALQGLENLLTVELSGVEFSADALFALAVRQPQKCSMPRRCISAKVGVRGVQKLEITTKFNAIVCDFVQLLLHQSALSELELLPRFRLELQIDTLNYQLPVNWSGPFRQRWIQLKRRLAEKSPHLQFSYDLISTRVTIQS